MMVEMSIAQVSPVTSAQMAEVGVFRPLPSARWSAHKTIDQLSQGRQVVRPATGLAEEHLGRALDSPLRPRQDIDEKVLHDGKSWEPGNGRSRLFVEEETHLITKMSEHLGSRHAAPPWRVPWIQAIEAIEELLAVQWIVDGVKKVRDGLSSRSRSTNSMLIEHSRGLAAET